MIAIFERGPDHSLVIATGDCRPVTLDGYLLMLYERYDRALAAFDAPTFNMPCWLPHKFVSWKITELKPLPADIFVRSTDDGIIPSEPAPECGLVSFTLPAWMVDHLNKLFTAALLDRCREEAVAREIEKEAERKREQRDRRRRMGQAAAAAKEKQNRTQQQPNLFEFRREC